MVDVVELLTHLGTQPIWRNQCVPDRVGSGNDTASGVNKLRLCKVGTGYRTLQRPGNGVVISNDGAVAHGLGGHIHHHFARQQFVFDLLGELVTVKEPQSDTHKKHQRSEIQREHPSHKGVG